MEVFPLLAAFSAKMTSTSTPILVIKSFVVFLGFQPIALDRFGIPRELVPQNVDP